MAISRISRSTTDLYAQSVQPEPTTRVEERTQSAWDSFVSAFFALFHCSCSQARNSTSADDSTVEQAPILAPYEYPEDELYEFPEPTPSYVITDIRHPPTPEGGFRIIDQEFFAFRESYLALACLLPRAQELKAIQKINMAQKANDEYRCQTATKYMREGIELYKDKASQNKWVDGQVKALEKTVRAWERQFRHAKSKAREGFGGWTEEL